MYDRSWWVPFTIPPGPTSDMKIVAPYTPPPLYPPSIHPLYSPLSTPLSTLFIYALKIRCLTRFNICIELQLQCTQIFYNLFKNITIIFMGSKSHKLNWSLLKKRLLGWIHNRLLGWIHNRLLDWIHIRLQGWIHNGAPWLDSHQAPWLDSHQAPWLDLHQAPRLI